VRAATKFVDRQTIMAMPTGAFCDLCEHF